MSQNDEKIACGFDRGVSFVDMKIKIIDVYTEIYNKYISLKSKNKPLKTSLRKLAYITIAQIQLSNGTRISESMSAFQKLIQPGAKEFVTIKIAKSHAIKVNKEGEKYETKARYRHVKYHNWFPLHIDLFNGVLDGFKNLRTAVLKFYNRYLDTNTHSLRYAFINHCLYHEKKDPTVVAKFIGHANMNTLLTYVQGKERDKLFDMESLK